MNVLYLSVASSFLMYLLCLCSYVRFFIAIHSFFPYISFAFTYLQAGANVNIIAGGATPLHIAADIGSTEIIESLLKAGADANVVDEVITALIIVTISSLS